MKIAICNINCCMDELEYGYVEECCGRSCKTYHMGLSNCRRVDICDSNADCNGQDIINITCGKKLLVRG